MNFLGGNKATNPCPCGFLCDRFADCRCSADRVVAYRRKISGPVLDRIDLHVDVPRPSTELLRAGSRSGETSRDVRARVESTWTTQLNRSGVNNARLRGEQLESVCDADDTCWALLESAAKRFNLSARAHQRGNLIRSLAQSKAHATPRTDNHENKSDPLYSLYSANYGFPIVSTRREFSNVFVS